MRRSPPPLDCVVTTFRLPIDDAGGATLPPDTGGSGSVNTPIGAATATLTLAPFTIDPGAEVFMCQNFDNPFGGVDTAVNRIVTDMTKGSHHLHVYNLTEGTGATPGSSYR